MKAKHWMPCLLAGLIVGGAALIALTGGEAEAGFTSMETKELLQYVQSDAAWNLRLQALHAISTRKSESGIEAELKSLAKGSDVKLAICVATALGKRKSSDAKAVLKSLLEASDLNVNVRIAALSAIAYHWKDSGDLSYLESKTKNDSKLASQCSWLKKHVYKK